MNHKRVERIWRREGLKVPAKQPKRGRLWLTDGSCVRLRPQRRNHVWAYDFVALRTSDGKPVRLLTVVDEYTRECLAIHVGRSLRSPHVIECLGDLMVQRGVPEHLRSDNGPEFTARAVRLWLQGVGATTLFITPGSPWENGYVESFNGKLRDELLDGSSSIPSGRCRSSPSSGATSTTTNAPTAPWLSPSCSRGHPHLLCSKRYQCLMICGTPIGGRSCGGCIGIEQQVVDNLSRVSHEGATYLLGHGDDGILVEG